MPTPKANWVEGEYFTPADANIVGQAIVDLQNEFATVESVLQFRGTWNATTNTPALVNGTGTAGHAYLVTTAGTALGKTFVVGDYVVYSGTIWDRATSTASEVTSTGVVTGSRLVSTVATGTAPLTVTSSTVVANLNAATTAGYGPAQTAAANTLAARDANTNLQARGFISGFTTTATAGATTTLIASSSQIQEFTGTLAQTVVLPTTGVVAGQQFTIINNSSVAVTVQSSSLATVATVYGGIEATFTALIATPTTPAHWEHAQINALMVSGYPTNGGLSLNTLAVRDAAGNVTATGFIPGLTSTATAGGTTTLVNNSRSVQEFTGTLAQTVVLPTTSVTAGQNFTIINNSTGSVTVQSSGLNSIVVLGANATTTVTALVATPTTAAHWDAQNGNASTLTGLSPSTVATASSIAQRDGAGSLVARSFIPGLNTQATAAATTTLVSGSHQIQEFTGTLAQTVVLPTTSVSAGQTFRIINNSTGAVTVQSSALAAVGAALTTGTSAEFIALVATPTTAAHWHRK